MMREDAANTPRPTRPTRPPSRGQHDHHGPGITWPWSCWVLLGPQGHIDTSAVSHV